MKQIKRILLAIFSFYRSLFSTIILYFRSIFTVKNLFHYDNFCATISVFLLFLGMGSCEMEVLDPIADAFADVELTDVFYSKIGKNQEFREDKNGNLKLDTTLYIVNIGNLPREAIAEMLYRINEGKPKVVALDIFFRIPKEPIIDSMLSDAFSRIENLVLISEGLKYDEENNVYDTVSLSMPYFNRHGHLALANMHTENVAENSGQFNVCRQFVTRSYIKSLETEHDYFAVKIAELYNPSSIKKLRKRNNTLEYINFIGNIFVRDALLPDYYRMPNIDKPHFEALEYTQLFDPDFDPIIFKDKIVLMGYLGGRLDKDEGEDKFYTPLNDKYIGKANKDMYGIVVHANIIATILIGHYINVMPKWIEHVIGLIIVYLTFASFRPLYNDYKVWYDGVSKFISLIIAIIILAIIGIIFDLWDYEITFGAIYFGAILIAGDYLEVYFGLFKNLVIKLINAFKNNN